MHYIILIIFPEVSKNIENSTVERTAVMGLINFRQLKPRKQSLLLLLIVCLMCLPVMHIWAQTDEPTSEPTTEVTVIVTSEPTAEPTAEPTSEETPEMTPEATVETTPEMTPEETVDATQEPTDESTAEPTGEVTDQPTTAPTLQPTAVPTIAPVEAEAEASDGLVLRGSYYAVPSNLVPDTGLPAILLLHMNQSTRASWEPVIQPLVDARYHVLAVDLRGFGETGGDRNWQLALEDVQVWLDWLRMQPGVDPAFVSVMGASIGANLALLGCGSDADCVTAIALSPGIDYFGIRPGESLNETLLDRPILLIVSQLDSQSITGVEEFFATARGEVGARIFTGRSHGTSLLMTYGDRLTPFIISWLDEHVEAKLRTITGS
jgi:acetyl esterase/lipase